MPHKTEEDLSETKSISAQNKKIQIALGICLAPCIGAEEIDFLHLIFLIFFSRAAVPIGQKAKTANMFSFG